VDSAEQVFLKLGDRIGKGAFADVFSPDGERAYKLFRRLTDPEIAHAQPLIFQSETDAYDIVSKHPELMKYTPAYFGRIVVSAVLNDAGEDVTGNYWPKLCYVMERLPPDPHERKFGSFFETRSWPRMQVIEQLFEGAGIKNLGDASLLGWRRKFPKIIDFGVTDAAADNWRPSGELTED
jgi:hypothetical protein